jgi:hypothetical protein
MAKSIKIPMASEYRLARRRALMRQYNTIREFATVLIQLVRHQDEDGRDIGFDYGDIHDAILRKFPKVTNNGPHRGKPTKMPIKELHEIACELNRNGVKLPFRPRRKITAKKK